jgi:2-oxo-4-hydroxy-4-carboxy-5-ureidoimidazoline decarboxylase
MDAWPALNVAPSDEARRVLATCCGSSRWVETMLRARPFETPEAMLEQARAIWFALDEQDWREAFGHHPAIGDRAALARRFPTTGHLSEREQAGVSGASDDVLDGLAECNRRYLHKFGYIFIVCAAGKSAAEMLELLQTRLHNDPATEIRTAAEEQARITELRLRAAIEWSG